MRGYTQVYTGNGKGKTTAALGLALRAAGNGMKVFIAQFVKGKIYNEIKSISQNLQQITVKQYGLECFINKKPTEKDIIAAQKGLTEVKNILHKATYDIIILDEINIALHFSLFETEEVLELIHSKPASTELIITGRYAKPEIIAAADLVTEMQEVKHYYQQGIIAREGIEY